MGGNVGSHSKATAHNRGWEIIGANKNRNEGGVAWNEPECVCVCKGVRLA